MADDGLEVDPTDVGAVADVLYRLDPGEFIARRTAFVKAARAAGDRAAAQQVQGFGRPTKAAWVLNLLARDAPDVVTRLADLGADLAAAQRDLDASTLRELSDRRRALVREVSRQAFEIAGEPRPSTALATEVQDTLTAAVVDPAVGEALQAGALLKAAQASGFGPTGPELAAVPAPRALRSVPPPPREPSSSKGSSSKASSSKASSSKGSSSSAGRSGPPAAQAKPPTAAEKRALAAAEREREKARAAAAAQETARRERVAASDRALADARTALETARDEEKAAAEALRILREQVRDADRALGDAGLAVREARAAVRQAEKARRETR